MLTSSSKFKYLYYSSWRTICTRTRCPRSLPSASCGSPRRLSRRERNYLLSTWIRYLPTSTSSVTKALLDSWSKNLAPYKYPTWPIYRKSLSVTSTNWIMTWMKKRKIWRNREALKDRFRLEPLRRSKVFRLTKCSRRAARTTWEFPRASEANPTSTTWFWRIVSHHSRDPRSSGVWENSKTSTSAWSRGWKKCTTTVTTSRSWYSTCRTITLGRSQLSQLTLSKWCSTDIWSTRASWIT